MSVNISSSDSIYHPRKTEDVADVDISTKKLIVEMAIKQKGELIDRVNDAVAKNKKFNIEEKNLIKDITLSSVVVKSNDYDSFQTNIMMKVNNVLMNKGYKEVSIREKLIELNRIMRTVSTYQIKHIIGPEASITRTEQARLSKLYDRGEEIPQYIKDFDVLAPHTLSPPDYLDVRLSRILQSSLMQLNRSSQKNIDIFIGPTSDFYLLSIQEGYKHEFLLNGKTSNSFYLMKNENSGDTKIAITGVLNSSRLAHLLLQLKFANVDLDHVRIRGKFEDALQKVKMQLFSELSSYNPPAEIAFIGNRTEVLISLAERIYPDEMRDVEPQNKEDMANRLLSDHQLKTVELGGKSIKFSYVVVKTEEGEKGVIAMRMPNGSLSYEATKLLLECGVKSLVMIGAGGSLKEDAGVGSYQCLDAASYIADTIEIDPDNKLEVEIPESIPVFNNRTNITVDSPLVENNQWMLDVESQDHASVDVESYHILKAFSEQCHSKPDLKIFSGIFTSDVVGTHPLEDKIDVQNAWKNLPTIIDKCLDACQVDHQLTNLE